MTISRIAPYAMPARTQWAPDTARWRPDPARAALLIHDMQRYFVDFLPSRRSPTIELIGNAVRARDVARAAGLPVIYSVQPARMTRSERGLLQDFWGPGMTGRQGSSEIIDELAPAPGDLLVTKYRYSAFFRTRLAELLASRGRDQLIVCGVFAGLGCLLTAADAYARDVQAFLLADAVADFSLPDHVAALDNAARGCAVTMTTGELPAHLLPPAGASATPAPPWTPGPASGRPGGGGN